MLPKKFKPNNKFSPKVTLNFQNFSNSKNKSTLQLLTLVRVESSIKINQLNNNDTAHKGKKIHQLLHTANLTIKYKTEIR